MLAIPFILLVDRSGKELWRHEGLIDSPELSKEVSNQLAATGTERETNAAGQPFVKENSDEQDQRSEAKEE